MLPAYGEAVNLSAAEARARFAAARVARLATVTPEGAPRLVPVTFALLGPALPVGATAQAGLATPAGRAMPARPAGRPEDPRFGDLGTIVTAVDHKPKRSTRLRRLDDIAHEPRVALLADEYDDDWTRLWWSRADGVARVREPPDPEHQSAVRALVARYPRYQDDPPSGPAILITVTRWSGWSFLPDDAAAAPYPKRQTSKS